MFSNLSQNSILYVLDLKGNPKILNGIIERVSIPRPKYNAFNPNMEMVVDITASIDGDRREFKGVPNTSLANFGDNAFILAENKEVLNSYINSMLQNSKSILSSVEKHKSLIAFYEDALQELNPDIKANKEKDRAISDLQGQIQELKETIQQMVTVMANKETL
jgi:hypothetical protein